MEAFYFMIPLALLFVIGFLIAFVMSAKGGQFDDLETPAHRILFDERKKDD